MDVTEDETSERQAQRVALEQTCAAIGRAIGKAVNDASGPNRKLGFAFLMFDFGAQGSLAYVSNAVREDMIRLLGEALGKLKEHTQ